MCGQQPQNKAPPIGCQTLAAGVISTSNSCNATPGATAGSRAPHLVLGTLVAIGPNVLQLLALGVHAHGQATGALQLGGHGVSIGGFGGRGGQQLQHVKLDLQTKPWAPGLAASVQSWGVRHAAQERY